MADTGKIVSWSEEETLDLGRRIGEVCSGAELIGLIGPLGAGKSVLARGIARGIGIDGPVRSPSFNLMREYKGRIILRHWDLYRLEGGFDTLGLLESIDDSASVVVEWADRWSGLKNHLTGTIYMQFGNTETERIITLAGEIPGATK